MFQYFSLSFFACYLLFQGACSSEYNTTKCAEKGKDIDQTDIEAYFICQAVFNKHCKTDCANVPNAEKKIVSFCRKRLIETECEISGPTADATVFWTILKGKKDCLSKDDFDAWIEKLTMFFTNVQSNNKVSKIPKTNGISETEVDIRDPKTKKKIGSTDGLLDEKKDINEQTTEAEEVTKGAIKALEDLLPGFLKDTTTTIGQEALGAAKSKAAKDGAKEGAKEDSLLIKGFKKTIKLKPPPKLRSYSSPAARVYRVARQRSGRSGSRNSAYRRRQRKERRASLGYRQRQWLNHKQKYFKYLKHRAYYCRHRQCKKYQCLVTRRHKCVKRKRRTSKERKECYKQCQNTMYLKQKQWLQQNPRPTK